jgi:hypothetical protein
MRSRHLAIALAVVVVLVAGEPVFAWGPATHVGLASAALGQLSLIPAAIAAILVRHRLSYLYGNIAADVVFAKRLSRVKQFCHHWATGFKLLDAAPDDRARAFAYGYLSHLAADTVAHGKFVPRQITVCDSGVNWGHFYWELRADNAAPAEDRRALECLLHADHHVHHRALAPHITDTFLPFPLNRLIFQGMSALAAGHGLHRTVDVCSRFSRQPLPTAILEGYRMESVDRILSVLSLAGASAVLRDDPNGTSALMSVHVRRRELRRLQRRGVSVERRRIECSHAFAPTYAPATGLFPSRAESFQTPLVAAEA